MLEWNLNCKGIVKEYNSCKNELDDKKLEPEKWEIDDPVKINKELNSFYETFFKVSMKKHHVTLMKCWTKFLFPF